MGSCVSSIHKNSQKFVISSPIKENNSSNVDRPILDLGLKYQLSPPTFNDFGSKEENFFDSQPWLESDCDDDFFSVKGDFTPSRGNTPVHQIFSSGNLLANKALTVDNRPCSIPQPSPTDKKKKLGELFRESIDDGEEVSNQNISSNQSLINEKWMEVNPNIHDPPPTSENGSVYFSGSNSRCSSERTSNGDIKLDKEKSLASAQCCLPKFLSSRSSSFDERSKVTSTAGSCR